MIARVVSLKTIQHSRLQHSYEHLRQVILNAHTVTVHPVDWSFPFIQVNSSRSFHSRRDFFRDNHSSHEAQYVHCQSLAASSPYVSSDTVWSQRFLCVDLAQSLTDLQQRGPECVLVHRTPRLRVTLHRIRSFAAAKDIDLVLGPHLANLILILGRDAVLVHIVIGIPSPCPSPSGADVSHCGCRSNDFPWNWLPQQSPGRVWVESSTFAASALVFS